jgi:hypothetical protein
MANHTKGKTMSTITTIYAMEFPYVNLALLSSECLLATAEHYEEIIPRLDPAEDAETISQLHGHIGAIDKELARRACNCGLSTNLPKKP